MMERNEAENVIRDTIEYANLKINKTKKKKMIIIIAITFVVALISVGLVLFLVF